MNIGMVLLAAVVGYLSGSISYAVLVTRLVSPDSQLTKVRITVPDSELVVETDTISATTVRLQLGARYGCIVGILDIAKAAVPALIFKLAFPDSPYYLIAAGMATAGHNWPVFHRFHGGRGVSPIMGGMLVVDWLGLLVTSLITGVAGVWTKNMLLTTSGFMILMVPWLAFRTRDAATIIYAVLMNVFFWSVMIPELKMIIKHRKSSDAQKFREATVLNVVGVDGEVKVDTITIPALRNKLVSWFKKADQPDDTA